MAKRRTLLMRLLSWAAGRFTPNTFYYSATLKAEVSKSLQKLDVRRGGVGNALGPACLSMSVAAAKHMPNVGDTLTSTIHGATNRGREIGSFRIHVERISDEEAAMPEKLIMVRESEWREMREALSDIASGSYSGVLLTSCPPKDPAVERARRALAKSEAVP